MQEIHTVGGEGGGRLFAGGGGGDRRLRAQHHLNHQALKCPRCDSLNTKFCYYNNYNLSQPRHFCKSCRRYWTKGGVLRNVPVGGGCRKTKRSKPKQNTSAATDAAPTTTAPPPPPPPPAQQPQREWKSSNSHSSSESSSLTATNTAATVSNGFEAVSAHSSSNTTNNDILNCIGESKIFANSNLNPSFDHGLLEQGSDCTAGIFSEIGSFTNLITSSTTHEQLPFGFSNMLSQQSVEHPQWQLQQQQKMVDMSGEELKMQEMAGGLIDQTVHVELSALQSSRSGNGGFGALDWQGSGDHGLFDLPNAVDQAFWSQSQWISDQDHSGLYLP